MICLFPQNCFNKKVLRISWGYSLWMNFHVHSLSPFGSKLSHLKAFTYNYQLLVLFSSYSSAYTDACRHTCVHMHTHTCTHSHTPCIYVNIQKEECIVKTVLLSLQFSVSYWVLISKGSSTRQFNPPISCLLISPWFFWF